MSVDETFAHWNRQAALRERKASPLAIAIVALEAIERAHDQPETVLEIAADTLAQLRDPATGEPWNR